MFWGTLIRYPENESKTSHDSSKNSSKQSSKTCPTYFLMRGMWQNTLILSVILGGSKWENRGARDCIYYAAMCQNRLFYMRKTFVTHTRKQVRFKWERPSRATKTVVPNHDRFGDRDANPCLGRKSVLSNSDFVKNPHFYKNPYFGRFYENPCFEWFYENQCFTWFLMKPTFLRLYKIHNHTHIL